MEEKWNLCSYHERDSFPLKVSAALSDHISRIRFINLSQVEGLTHRLFSALRRRSDFSGDEDPDPPPRRTSRRSGAPFVPEEP